MLSYALNFNVSFDSKNSVYSSSRDLFHQFLWSMSRPMFMNKLNNKQQFHQLLNRNLYLTKKAQECTRSCTTSSVQLLKEWRAQLQLQTVTHISSAHLHIFSRYSLGHASKLLSTKIPQWYYLLLIFMFELPLIQGRHSKPSYGRDLSMGLSLSTWTFSLTSGELCSMT